MRIVFMGNPEFSIPSLKAVVHSDFKVVGVMTNPPKNMGRGRYEHHSPVCITAKELGIPLVFADNLKSDHEVVLEAVKQNGNALRFASDSVKADREFLLEAVKLDGFALNCADEKLQHDPELRRISGID